MYSKVTINREAGQIPTCTYTHCVCVYVCVCVCVCKQRDRDTCQDMEGLCFNFYTEVRCVMLFHSSSQQSYDFLISQTRLVLTPQIPSQAAISQDNQFEIPSKPSYPSGLGSTQIHVRVLKFSADGCLFMKEKNLITAEEVPQRFYR